MESIPNLENRLSIKVRLGSMLLDHAIICFAIGSPLIVISFIFKSDDPFATSPVESVAYFVMMLIYFNKDFFNGRSVAKRILGLQIIDRKTNQPANELKCFLRNMTIPVWPLEVFISLIIPTRRLGDLIANTRIEKTDREDFALTFAAFKKIRLTYLTLWTLVISSIYMGILWYAVDRLVTL